MCAFPDVVEHAEERRPETGPVCLWRPVGTLQASWPDLCAPQQGDGTFPVRLSAAQYAMDQAQAWLDADDPGQALLHLRVVESALPEIIDHISMLEAEAHEALGQYELAAERYFTAALETPNADLRALARVGRARALLAAKDPSAPRVVTDLVRRYPEVPEAAELKYGLGELREHQGRLPSAIAFYRSLDLNYPGYPAADKARARLDALREQKVWIPQYTPTQRVERAERLVSSGPPDLARESVRELMDAKLAADLKLRVDAMAARLALVEGRFDAARQHARKSPEASAEPAPAEEERLARLRVKHLLRGRKPAQVIPVHLVAGIELAARAQVVDLTDELVAALTARGNRAPARVRFDGLVAAAGVATEPQLIALASTLVDTRGYSEAALYHRGRAHERAGETELAKADYEAVMERDDTTSRYYANWADNRLRALSHYDTPDPCFDGTRLRDRCDDGRPAAKLASGLGPDLSTAISRLAPVAHEHGDGYPWLGRALALLQLGEAQRAADELHEAYLSWRTAAGRSPLRAGTDAIFRGQGVARLPKGWAIRRARLALDAKARAELAAVSSALGDYGTAVLFGGRKWAEPLPRPFAEQVQTAAARHGIDPDLLYAVMRVESVYNNRIISYAGAVGLMQIMPRTGRLIADAQGHGHLTTTDLIRPEVNIDFAAWYLRSLLERMDGRVPLAIASYNGGPHNVRKWIHRYGEHMPLDAFLERIPFTQTHRYVRRVLGYYAQYRAQRGEKLALMTVELPEPEPDIDVAF